MVFKEQAIPPKYAPDYNYSYTSSYSVLQLTYNAGVKTATKNTL